MALTVEVNGTTWDKESIRALLKRNDRAVERAISLINSYQTVAEQDYGTSTTLNGVEFNKFDAYILTNYAIAIDKGYSLSQKQLELGRNKILKYSNQLLKIMANKQ